MPLVAVSAANTHGDAPIAAAATKAIEIDFKDIGRLHCKIDLHYKRHLTLGMVAFDKNAHSSPKVQVYMGGSF